MVLLLWFLCCGFVGELAHVTDHEAAKDCKPRKEDIKKGKKVIKGRRYRYRRKYHRVGVVPRDFFDFVFRHCHLNDKGEHFS